jgi:hypothetical protein
MKYRAIPEAPAEPKDFEQDGDARIAVLEFEMKGIRAFVVGVR